MDLLNEPPLLSDIAENFENVGLPSAHGYAILASWTAIMFAHILARRIEKLTDEIYRCRAQGMYR